MRNTLFVVSQELAPYVDASNARAVAVKERRTFLSHLADDGNGLDERWLADTGRKTLAALAARGPATGGELFAAVADLRTKITVFPGKKYEGVQGVASRVIRILAAGGRIRCPAGGPGAGTGPGTLGRTASGTRPQRDGLGRSQIPPP
ncbi:winged helix DNA-binding domain-containing protein [Streptomyces sp. R-74717]|uniref:DNA glycosylase AlkZ-like family protein n=1 Tax=Streptomyces TaxID=1883 RepID=UPI0037ACA3C9